VANVATNTSRKVQSVSKMASHPRGDRAEGRRGGHECWFTSLRPGSVHNLP
jgi:hypothetical protein